MEHKIFIKEWIKRSERKEAVDYIDKGDQFICLWISFNAWMKSKFGEKLNDNVLIDRVVVFNELENVFDELKKEQTFNQNLIWLTGYKVADMRDSDNDERKEKYDGTFESLIRTIYQIRCNLFHGRKNFDDNKTDFELVCLANDILLPLFKKYLQNNYLI